jgi:muconolactone delta-isomerase
MNQELNDAIDAMDENIHDMTPQDFDRVVAGHTEEAFNLRRQRKQVRYMLYRIQTEALGGPAADDTDNIKEKFESLPMFGGWRFFGITWDVAHDDPFRVVSRDHSVQDEWEAVVASKYPTVEPGTGRVVYPDIKVKAAVEKEAKTLAKK